MNSFLRWRRYRWPISLSYSAGGPIQNHTMIETGKSDVKRNIEKCAWEPARLIVFCTSADALREAAGAERASLFLGLKPCLCCTRCWDLPPVDLLDDDFRVFAWIYPTDKRWLLDWRWSKRGDFSAGEVVVERSCALESFVVACEC